MIPGQNILIPQKNQRAPKKIQWRIQLSVLSIYAQSAWLIVISVVRRNLWVKPCHTLSPVVELTTRHGLSVGRRHIRHQNDGHWVGETEQTGKLGSDKLAGWASIVILCKSVCQ
jgi:hypothetical protein